MRTKEIPIILLHIKSHYRISIPTNLFKGKIFIYENAWGIYLNFFISLKNISIIQIIIMRNVVHALHLALFGQG